MLRNTVPDPYSGNWKCSVAIQLSGYEEQTVRETKWNADAFKTPTLLVGEVCQRGMTLPSYE